MPLLHALIVVVLLAAAPPIWAAPIDRDTALAPSRAALRGESKDLPRAKELLETLLQNEADLDPATRCYAYVYLGYIEDRSGNRDAALGWFEKAAILDGPNVAGIRAVAESGLTKPITWIRHLDETHPQPRAPGKIMERIGRGYVTQDEPDRSIPPRMDLNPEEQIENFDVLWEAIDRNFAFFSIKNIDWEGVRDTYRPQAGAAKTAEEFYAVLDQVVRELHDCHSWLCNYHPNQNDLNYNPGVCLKRIEGEPVVVRILEPSRAYEQGLRPGWKVASVDGESVADRMELLRPLLRVSSSERNFLDSASSRLLDGAQDTTVRIEAQPPVGGAPITMDLERAYPREIPPYEPGFPLKHGPFVSFGKHPSGCGYIRIATFNGRMEIADAFDQALESLRDTPALIVDIRDNTGGYGTAHYRIVGRFLTERKRVATSYIKNGPDHGAFRTNETYCGPAGDWQYTKPVALLLNAQTGSAADLFACYFISTGRPLTVGATTHGNLSGTGAYIVLPYGLAVRVSNGYICSAAGVVIEGNGNVPDIPVEPTIADVVQGRDAALERAVAELETVGN